MTVAINEDAAGVFWSWNHSRTELQELTSEQQREFEEASSAGEAKVRSFTQARQAVEAKSLSRGFYPFAPHLKGKKGKGKRFGKSKRNSKSKMTSMSSRPSPPVLDSAEAFAVGPGTLASQVALQKGVSWTPVWVYMMRLSTSFRYTFGVSACVRGVWKSKSNFNSSPIHQLTNSPIHPCFLPKGRRIGELVNW